MKKQVFQKVAVVIVTISGLKRHQTMETHKGFQTF